MTEMVRKFVEQMGDTYATYAEMEREVEMPTELVDYFDGLLEDISELAKQERVSLLDVYSISDEEEEVKEEWLAYCSLPESVDEFAELSGCGFSFIASLFAIVESQNEVAGFQLAEGEIFCNWISPYRILTTDYLCFKEIVGSELADLAAEAGESVRAFLYGHSVYLYGNRVGKEFFGKLCDEIEEEHCTSGIEKIAKLYQKAQDEEKNPGKETKISFVKLYQSYQRELAIDLLNYTLLQGSCVFHKEGIEKSNLPKSILRFWELSGCERKEIESLFYLAAEKLEQQEGGKKRIVYAENLEEGKKQLIRVEKEEEGTEEKEE